MSNWRFVLLACMLAPSGLAQDGGGEYKVAQDVPCLTEQQREQIQARIRANVIELRSRGLLGEVAAAVAPPGLSWPIFGTPSLQDFTYDGISNFVDLNPASPGSILDYYCGARSYDTASGYNHAGVDIFSWPFPWYRMDRSLVAVVAAAPGVIVDKDDGNFDHSCSMNSNPWNAVYVQHDDGSVAWYGHLKNGTTTTKLVGASVVRGEYLGIVGSSGSSTGPHLHLEIHDSQNAVVETHAGACNPTLLASWWISQRPYYDSTINMLATHSAAPVFPSCPAAETPNLRSAFLPGDLAYFAAYYHDQLAGQTTSYTLYKPDGSVFQTWSQASSAAHYAASYWYFTWSLPATRGAWRFRAVYQGQTREIPFRVGLEKPVDLDGDRQTDHTVYHSASGLWYSRSSQTGSVSSVGYGGPGYVPVPGDYDGDGKTDIAVYSASGLWYVRQSSTGITATASFGGSGYAPVRGDFDGDGKTDIAVFHSASASWFVKYSGSGSVFTLGYGGIGYVPVPGDYDGDGRADLAVFDPPTGLWFLRQSSTGSTVTVGFGGVGYTPVRGDYDGDGKTDVAVYHDATGLWYVRSSATGAVSTLAFGGPGYLPVAEDYDGDGKTDIAVYHASSGLWFARLSSNGVTATVGLGGSGYSPVN